MMKRLACRARKEIACESESPHNNNVRKTSSLALRLTATIFSKTIPIASGVATRG